MLDVFTKLAATPLIPHRAARKQLQEEIDRGRAAERELRETCDRLQAQIAEHAERLAHTNQQLTEEAARRGELEAVFQTTNEAIPFGAWIYNRAGEAKFLSSSYLSLLGATLEECHGKSWISFLPVEDQPRATEAWERCVCAGDFWDYEFRVFDAQHEPRFILSRGVPLRDATGRVTSYAGIQVDITERVRLRDELVELKSSLEDQVNQQTEQLKRANAQLLLDLAERVKTEVDLRDRKAQLRAVFQNTLDAMIVIDDSRKVLDANPSAMAIFARSREELIGARWDDLIPPSRRPGLEERWEVFLKEGFSRGETPVQRTDGSKRVAAHHSRANILPGRHLVCLQDISGQKEAEYSLRDLSHRLIKVQDQERRRIARELHDSTGQCLAAMRMNLDAVEKEVASLSPKAAKALTESLTLAKTCASDVRTISYLLHPPLLDEIGLVPAVRWFVDGFMERCGICVEVEVSPEWVELSEDLNTALFRILQESLTNIHRHSESATARVRLMRDDGVIRMEISDQGRGIPAEKLGAFHSGMKGLGVGIAGMRERVRQLGGEMRIQAGEPGTTITVEFPMEVNSGNTAAASGR